MAMQFRIMDGPLIWRELNPDVLRVALRQHRPTFDVIDPECLKNPNVVCLLTRGGGSILIGDGHGLYEGHVWFSEGYRGAYAIRAARDMLSAMFDLWNAETIMTDVPVNNRAARLFNRRIGMLSLGETMTLSGSAERFAAERPTWELLDQSSVTF